MNNAGMYWYMRMQLSVWDLYFNSFGCISRSGFVGSYGSFTFNVLSNIHTSFHSSYVSLHPHQQCRRVPHLPHSCQHLLSFFLSFYLFNLSNSSTYFQEVTEESVSTVTFRHFFKVVSLKMSFLWRKYIMLKDLECIPQLEQAKDATLWLQIDNEEHNLCLLKQKTIEGSLENKRK